ncbi:MAG: hypothetical protein Q9223_001769, partial [Gallowayella weberi]
MHNPMCHEHLANLLLPSSFLSPTAQLELANNFLNDQHQSSCCLDYPCGPASVERMPYTPPAHRSPAVSESTTPANHVPQNPGREQQRHTSSSNTTPRPHSSSTYLNRQRRSPSLTKPTASFSLGPEDKGDGAAHELAAAEKSESVTTAHPDKESPPTTSSQTSSDDDDHASNSERGRVLDLPNLAALQAAIMLIEQHRESSPARVTEERLKARATLGLQLPRVDPLAKEHSENPKLSTPLPLSAAARKISHSRSNTDVTTLLDIPPDVLTRSASESDLDELDDDSSRIRPIPVRKKSGELVKPVLTRGGLRRRPSSMPGTPTYRKGVHFDSDSLEKIRTFDGRDRPIVVSTGTSPAEQYDNEIEFPFGEDPSINRAPAYEWEIHLSNFPRETLARKSAPVRVERIYLSSDNKNLMGAVVVANLAFHKTVVARFTLDYWKTTSEVVADYNNDIRRKQVNDGYDRFVFSIKLEDQAKLEEKTMFFCVRYSVNGQEFWDNNNSVNYQVDFAKKAKADKKQGTQGTSSPLPRSKQSHSKSSVRPRSFPSTLDDFGSFDSFFDLSSSNPPPAQLIGDSPIRLKAQKPTSELAADESAQRNNGSNPPFGQRYDFGVSLHNAIAAASPALGDRGDPKYIKESPSQRIPFAKQPLVESGSIPSSNTAKSTSSGGEKAAGSVDTVPKITALATEKPSLESKSYQELLDSYCF